MAFWKDLISQGLEDDRWQWDWTTLGSVQSVGQKVVARLVAKSSGIWAGYELMKDLEELSQDLRMPIQVKGLMTDGIPFKKGDLLCTWAGSARAVLAFERPAINLAAYASGIASSTHELVTAVAQEWKRKKYQAEHPRVTCSRKILPHYRDLAIHAVRIGGGVAHRISLSGGVLIKENHIKTAGSIARAIRGVHDQCPHGLRIEVEVKNLKELKEAINSGADAVLLDNFTPTQVKQALKMNHEMMIEVSGGITAQNISQYAVPGVRIISSGSITHSVKSSDLSLLVD